MIAEPRGIQNDMALHFAQARQRRCARPEGWCKIEQNRNESISMTTEQRIGRLEEAVVRIEGRLDGLQEATNELRREMNSRLNLQMQITVAMWGTTMLGIIATLVAVVLGG